jgi:hypothetical protein
METEPVSRKAASFTAVTPTFDPRATRTTILLLSGPPGPDAAEAP